MPKLTNQEMETFLAEPAHLCRIATVREDGGPHVTPVWFLHENGKIHITPRKHSEFWANIRRDPRVALAIDEEANLYRKVVVHGTAEILHEPGEDDVWRDLYRRIACRYVDEESADFYIQETIDQPRPLIAVDLARSEVETWRMPGADEPYTGIWAARYYDRGTKMAKQVEEQKGAATGSRLRFR